MKITIKTYYVFITFYNIAFFLENLNGQDPGVTKRIIGDNTITTSLWEGDLVSFNFTITDLYSSSVGCSIDQKIIIKYLGQSNKLITEYSSVIDAFFTDNVLHFTIKLLATYKNISCVVFDNGNAFDQVGNDFITLNVQKPPQLRVNDYIIYSSGNQTLFTCNCTGSNCQLPKWSNLPFNGIQKTKVIGNNPPTFISEASILFPPKINNEYQVTCSLIILDRIFNVTTVLRNKDVISELTQKATINTGAIVGGIVGGILFLLLITGILIYYFRIRPKSIKYSELNKNETRPIPKNVNENFTYTSKSQKIKIPSPKSNKIEIPPMDDSNIPDIDANMTSYL